MKEFKGIPGSWHYDDELGGVYSNGDQFVCDVTNKDDANVIAAAPELLEALQKMLSVAVCYWDEGGAGRSCCFVPESLKPLRTEAERKHEAVLESICAVLEMVAQDYKREDEAKLIYEAIAAGKIPGVKLED